MGPLLNLLQAKPRQRCVGKNPRARVGCKDCARACNLLQRSGSGERCTVPTACVVILGVTIIECSSSLAGEGDRLTASFCTFSKLLSLALSHSQSRISLIICIANHCNRRENTKTNDKSQRDGQLMCPISFDRIRRYDV